MIRYLSLYCVVLLTVELVHPDLSASFSPSSQFSDLDLSNSDLHAHTSKSHLCPKPNLKMVKKHLAVYEYRCRMEA